MRGKPGQECRATIFAHYPNTGNRGGQFIGRFGYQRRWFVRLQNADVRRAGVMMILEEAAQIVRHALGREFDDITVQRVVIGIFFTGVKLSTGAGGMCYTPIKEIPQAVCCPSSAGTIFNPMKVEGMPVWDILPALTSREPMKAATAIATLNALSATRWDRGQTGGYTMEMKMDDNSFL